MSGLPLTASEGLEVKPLKPKRMHVSLVVPEEWREKIRVRIKAKGYTSLGEYVRSLIREDLERAGLLKNSEVVRE